MLYYKISYTTPLFVPIVIQLLIIQIQKAIDVVRGGTRSINSKYDKIINPIIRKAVESGKSMKRELEIIKQILLVIYEW